MSIRRILTGLLAGSSLVLLTAAPALAQAANRTGTAVGVKGGMSSTTLEFTGGSDVFDPVTGVIAGIYVDQPLFSVVGVTVEALYARKGATDVFIDRRLAIDYLELPLLARVGGPAWGGVYGFVGPAIALRLRATFGGVSVPEQYEKSDVAWVGGGGVQFGRFLVEGRVTLGRRNVAADLLGMDKITNRAISVMGGFRIW